MFRCRIVKFLFTVLPFRRWRGFLIRRHIERCVGCGEELASRSEVRAVLVQTGDFENRESLWPRISRELGEKESPETDSPRVPRREWKWAFGAAALFVIAVMGLLFLREADILKIQPFVEKQAIRFELKYVRIGGETANAFVYQPKNSDVIIVWAGKSDQGGHS